MTGDDVLSVVGCLTDAGIKIWLDGGWGVDALIGTQTRPHDDLDAVIQLDQADAAVALLASLGYRISLDDRPTRLVLGNGKERRIDFHPIILDRDGNGRQIGAGPNGGDAVYAADGLKGTGAIGSHVVSCLTPELLLKHHTGYKPQDKDHHNVRLLCQEFGLSIPPAYQKTDGRSRGDRL